MCSCTTEFTGSSAPERPVSNRRKPGFFHHRFRGIGYFAPLPDLENLTKHANEGARLVARSRVRPTFTFHRPAPAAQGGRFHETKSVPTNPVGQISHALGSQDTKQDTKLDRLRFQDCYREMIAIDRRAVDEIHRKWVAARAKDGVVSLVKTIDHKTLYSMTVDQVEEACEKTTHALGQTSKRHLEANPLFRDINDFNVPFAYLHGMHKMMEDLGRLPLWQDVMPFYEDNPKILLGLYREHFKYEEANTETRRFLDDAIAWRLGLAYYSFLREVDLFVRIREVHDIDLRYHLFADVTLSTDFWIDNCIISLYLNNSRFKTADGKGRKKRTSSIFKNNDSLSFIDVDISKRTQRGCVWLVPDHEIARAAELIIRARGQ